MLTPSLRFIRDMPSISANPTISPGTDRRRRSFRGLYTGASYMTNLSSISRQTGMAMDRHVILLDRNFPDARSVATASATATAI